MTTKNLVASAYVGTVAAMVIPDTMKRGSGVLLYSFPFVVATGITYFISNKLFYATVALQGVLLATIITQHIYAMTQSIYARTRSIHAENQVNKAIQDNQPKIAAIA